MSSHKWILIIGGAIGFSVAVLLFLFAVALFPMQSDLIPSQFSKLVKDLLSPLVSGFGGAVAGAYTASRLQKREDEVRSMEMEVKAVNSTLYALHSMINDLVVIRRDTFHPHSKSQLRFIEIPTLPSVNSIPPRVDMDIIHFFAKYRRNEGTKHLYLAENSYYAVIDNIKQRNIMMAEYRGLVSDSGLMNTTRVTLGQIAQAVNPLRIISLYSYTENLIDFMDNAIDSLVSAVKYIEVSAKDSFKGSGKYIFFAELDVKVISDKSIPPLIGDVDNLKKILGYNMEYSSGALASSNWRPA